MKKIKITCDVCGRPEEHHEKSQPSGFKGKPWLTLMFGSYYELSETIAGIEDVCMDCSKMITEYIRAAINTIAARKDVYQQERTVSKP